MIKEQVLSREQMAHLEKLGIDTSDASMYWIVTDKIEKKENDLDAYPHYHLALSVPTMIPEHLKITVIPTYTIGDLIEKLPLSIKGSYGEFNRHIANDGKYIEVGYDNGGDHCPVMYYNIPLLESLYNLLCWVAENHKELKNK